MNRIVIVARLLPDSRARIEELLESGPPFDPRELGLTLHTVHLTATEAVFTFEAPEVEWIVDDLLDDPVLAGAFAAWMPHLDGSPRLAQPRFAWSRDDEGG